MDLVMHRLLHLGILVACLPFLLHLALNSSYSLLLTYFEDSSFISSFLDYSTWLLVVDLTLSFILTLGYY
jgi:hypothetical protein